MYGCLSNESDHETVERDFRIVIEIWVERMAEVSIIVPVYQVENYIRQCVDSILAQTFTDFELILVDDGSKDQAAIRDIVDAQILA